jgi:HKD family nuclease
MTTVSAASRSTFADNQRVTIADAVRACAIYRNHQYGISIATGYFNLGGFSSIADVLEAAPSVQIMIGAEPEAEVVPDTLEIDRDDPLRAINRIEKAIVAGRDELGFSSASEKAIARLKDFLARPTTKVKIYRKRFLHGKAYIFGEEEAVIAGSANFTAAGLNHNLELDLGQYEPDRVRRVHEWFEALWKDAVDFDLAGIFDARLETYEPHTIYLRMLYAQYSPELVVDEAAQEIFGAMQLADFQRLGSQRALRILDEWHGAILADGVGLGKTIIAGDVIQTYTRDRGLRVLIVCPASLRPMWTGFLAKHLLPGSVLSYAQLARDRRLGEGDGNHLEMAPDQYRLVVADEGHALRSNETAAYRAMRSLLAQSPKAHLLLLTATPVNNSLWDLYNEVMLFAKTDSRFDKVGIRDLRQHIKDAMKVDADNIDPSYLFAILDAISVRRTRRFVKEHFPNARIGDQLIVFPEVVSRAERYDLDAVIPGLFEDVESAVEDDLTMARYQTQLYAVEPSETGSRQEAMAGLLRSQMLKRFESSAFAFRRTLTKMIASHDACLNLIEQDGKVPLRALDAETLLNEEAVAERIAEGDIVDASAFDSASLCRDLRSDIAVLKKLEGKISGLLPKDDPKLEKLVAILRQGAEDPNPDKRKTLVFTSFVDTVEYIREHLSEVALVDPVIEGLVARSAYVLGNQQTDVDDRTAFACGFAPRSMLPDDPAAEDKYDLLVTTDVLAEGQNLQQCGRVVNFDLPWNPMRIVQRNGRIDRIFSPHDTVYAHCFMPDLQLDAILKLEERLQRKIAQANVGIGVESTIVPGIAIRERNFADAEDIESEKASQIKRLAEGDTKVLDELDRDDAYSGEQFREELRSALLSDAGSDLEKLAWGIGSGHNRGKGPAVVFLIRAGRRHYFRLMPLSETDGSINADLLAALKTARCDPATPRSYPDEIRDVVYDAWTRVRHSLYAQVQEQRDPATQQASLPKAQRDAIDLLQRANSEAAASATEALASRWPTDVERDLRAILRDEALGEPERVEQIVEYVATRGLRAETPEEVPDIREGDIKLICYQVIVPSNGGPVDAARP